MALSTDRPGYHALRRGRWSQSGQIYLLTTVTTDRQPIFQQWEAASAAAQTLSNPRCWQGGQLLCWVLMPDHWHGLLQLGETAALSSMMRHAKSSSSQSVNRSIGGSGGVWMAGFHDRALRRDEDTLSAARYIVANPLRAGLMGNLCDYPYWDAIWL